MNFQPRLSLANSFHPDSWYDKSLAASPVIDMTNRKYHTALQVVTQVKKRKCGEIFAKFASQTGRRRNGQISTATEVQRKPISSQTPCSLIASAVKSERAYDFTCTLLKNIKSQ